MSPLRSNKYALDVRAADREHSLQPRGVLRVHPVADFACPLATHGEKAGSHLPEATSDDRSLEALRWAVDHMSRSGPMFVA